MTNQEYIDAINKALEILEAHKKIIKSGGIYSGESRAIRKGCDESKRLCTNCATAYVGTYRCPNCNCGAEGL